jgi:hypothetical protein
VCLVGNGIEGFVICEGDPGPASRECWEFSSGGRGRVAQETTEGGAAGASSSLVWMNKFRRCLSFIRVPSLEVWTHNQDFHQFCTEWMKKNSFEVQPYAKKNKV